MVISRNILWVIISMLLMLNACDSDSGGVLPPDTAPYVPSDSARTFYFTDAVELAVDYLYESRSRDTSFILPPDSIVNRYLLPLARLYDERSVNPLLDTLIGHKQIHKHILRGISTYFSAETSQVWVQNIIHHVIPTGEPLIDSLVETYNLTFGSIYQGYPNDRVSIYIGHQPLNNRELSRVLLTVPGVINAGPSGGWSMGSDIRVIPYSESTLIHLYFGWDDCPSGCLEWEQWTYAVTKDFEIIYLGNSRQ